MLRTLMLPLLFVLPAASSAQSIDFIHFRGDAMGSFAGQSAVNAAIGQAAEDATAGAGKRSEQKDRQREAGLPFTRDPQVTRQVEDGFVSRWPSMTRRSARRCASWSRRTASKTYTRTCLVATT